jgi:hypothetical protein
MVSAVNQLDRHSPSRIFPPQTTYAENFDGFPVWRFRLHTGAVAAFSVGAAGAPTGAVDVVPVLGSNPTMGA